MDKMNMEDVLTEYVEALKERSLGVKYSIDDKDPNCIWIDIYFQPIPIITFTFTVKKSRKKLTDEMKLKIQTAKEL